jgi:nucleotide-binding universal stress UspA family protein
MAAAPTPYAHIACAVDDSPAARRALDEAVRLRALGPGRLSVVHVMEAIPMAALMGEGAAFYADDPVIEQRTRDWLDGVAKEVRGEPVFLTGYPPAAVAEWARAAEVDLLVAAAHRGRVERLLLGSFASFLAHHAPCAVLLVRPVAEAAG